MEYDIWADDEGSAKALPAYKPFVDDSDAPYGYSRHMIRLTASNRRQAMNEFRSLNRTA